MLEAVARPEARAALAQRHRLAVVLRDALSAPVENKCRLFALVRLPALPRGQRAVLASGRIARRLAVFAERAAKGVPGGRRAALRLQPAQTVVYADADGVALLVAKQPVRALAVLVGNCVK